MSTENITRESEWFEDKQDAIALRPSEEYRDWAHFTDTSQKTDSSITSSCGDSEDEEEDEDDEIWTVNNEQREYYTKQFKTMQTDLTAMISGNVSKEFFEKSGLPTDELSKIWELSDVNKDGALSLDEFWTAMHLVVLRRNNFKLPDILPNQLIPYSPLNNSGSNQDINFSIDRPKGSTIKKLSPSHNQWSASFSPLQHQSHGLQEKQFYDSTPTALLPSHCDPPSPTTSPAPAAPAPTSSASQRLPLSPRLAPVTRSPVTAGTSDTITPIPTTFATATSTTTTAAKGWTRQLGWHM